MYCTKCALTVTHSYEWNVLQFVEYLVQRDNHLAWGMEGGGEGEREGGREGGRVGGWEGEWEGRREGGGEGERTEHTFFKDHVSFVRTSQQTIMHCYNLKL